MKLTAIIEFCIGNPIPGRIALSVDEKDMKAKVGYVIEMIYSDEFNTIYGFRGQIPPKNRRT